MVQTKENWAAVRCIAFCGFHEAANILTSCICNELLLNDRGNLFFCTPKEGRDSFVCFTLISCSLVMLQSPADML